MNNDEVVAKILLRLEKIEDLLRDLCDALLLPDELEEEMKCA